MCFTTDPIAGLTGFGSGRLGYGPDFVYHLSCKNSQQPIYPDEKAQTIQINTDKLLAELICVNQIHTSAKTEKKIVKLGTFIPSLCP